jgi:hypothetical protein
MFYICIDTNKYTLYNEVKVKGVVRMKKETMRNLVGILLFYSIIVFGVIAINARLETIENEPQVISLDR